MLANAPVFSNAKNKKIPKIPEKFVNMPTKSRPYMYKINKKRAASQGAPPVLDYICLCTLLYSS